MAELPLSNSPLKAIVDDAVYPFVKGYRWRLQKGYVYTGKGTSLARIISGASKDEVAHHRDGNPLNNRRENLQPMPRDVHTRLHCRERLERKKL